MKKIWLFLMVIVPWLIGGYFEWCYCLCGILAAVSIVLTCHSRKELTLTQTLWGWISIPAVLLLGAAAAQDKGMVLLGFVKYLALFLLALSAAQLTEAQRCSALDLLPHIGAVMVVVCLPLSFLPIFKGHLLVAQRQAGFFEYPNAYGLFLLLGWLRLADRRKQAWEWGELAVLTVGIVLTGSRSVWLLLVLGTVMTFSHGGRRNRLWVAAGILGCAAAAFVWMAVRGQTGHLLSSSTIWGRLLYVYDAVPIILTHPFGIGYRSYVHMQGSFQSGVYSVQNLHNDFLQLALEAGWIPFVLLAAAVVRSLRKKDKPQMEKRMLCILLLHGCMDFSMQYLAIVLPLLLLLDGGKCRSLPLRKGAAIGLIPAVLFAYVGITSFCAYLGFHGAAVQMYPLYTESLIQQMENTDDSQQADTYAKRVLALNPYVADAYRIRARYAFENGDLRSVMALEEKAMANAPYDKTVYTDYMQLLSLVMPYYYQSGDTASGDICRKVLLSLPQRMEAVLSRTSKLGWLIGDKPDLKLTEEEKKMITLWK